MKVQLTIICDIEVPAWDLLNSERFEVIKTEKEDTFAMVAKKPNNIKE